ncbi:MAG: hypothetical protein LBP69_01380 [Treponema sp.]|jgi:hypothetical protein|nr:hypothetical protein [Treponema sp.]
MIGFLLKKTFFDLWDNLFKVVLLNVGFVASAAIPICGLFLTPIPALGIGLALAGILWCGVYLAAAARILGAVSDYGSFGFVDFFAGLRRAWPAGLVAGSVMPLVWLLIWVIFPFYLGLNSPVGLFLAAAVFWISVGLLLSMQFFLALHSRLERNIPGALWKCLLIFADNPLFCLFSFFHNLILLILSVFLIFLFPGPAGILLYLDEALRLRLLKYDWIKANPQENRRKIPWDALLVEEREKTGTRSLKSFIFPWKD